MIIEKDRNIELLRGVMIILVVLGHAIIPEIRGNNLFFYNIWRIIYYFHMPVFFMISGYCCKEIKFNSLSDDEYKSFVKKKFKRLMLPYIFISFANYTILLIATTVNSPIKVMLIESGYKFNGIVQSILEIITFYGHFDDHVWFLYTLFIIFLIIPVMKKIIKSEKKLIIIYVLLSLLSYSGILDNTIPLLEKTCRYLLFVMIGLKLNFKSLNKCKVMKEGLRSIFIIFILLNINGNSYIIKAIEGIFKIVLSIDIMYLFYFLMIKLESNRILEIVSKYSFEIYLLHQPFITSGLVLILYKLLNIGDTMSIIISTIIGILIPIIMTIGYKNKNIICYRSSYYEKQI